MPIKGNCGPLCDGDEVAKGVRKAAAEGGSAGTARSAGRWIRIAERDGDVIYAVAQARNGEMMEIMASMRREGDTIILSGVHVQGSGSGALGTSAVGELRSLARDFASQEGASTLVIEGGRRSSGAGPGHVPRALVIRTE